MEHIEQLRRFLDGSSRRFEISPEGEEIELDVGPAAPEAVVVVRAATDALKDVSRGRIQGSIDRDRVWEVIGFSVSREVAETLVANLASADWLTEVVSAGVEWEVIDRSAGP